MAQLYGISDGSININDVIEVIQTNDPEFVAFNERENQETTTEMAGGRLMPYVEIVEQPASKALRFRYECEGRSAGSIPGVNSTPENKTFPSIRIVGYKGRAMVVVSCVTKDLPHRPHPHNLVGKEACKRGVCTVEVSSENMMVTFANLGIQCVKKKDIEEALRIREEIRVDPFRTGFEHKRQPTSIDLNAVRLCFQVFIEGSQKGKFNVPLQPVVSDPIYDKKAMSDLVICKLSHYSASVAGGMGMILLCEKVAKEDIQIRFFEEKDGQVVWEGYGDFQPSHVHKQTGIWFRTPSYRMQQVEQPVQVYIQLKRPSDNATSEALPFELIPLCSDDEADTLRRKRQKFNNSPSGLVLRHIQAEAEKHATALNQPIQYNFNIIKPEPMDRVSPYGGAVATGTSFPVYPVGTTTPQSQTNVQTLRPQISPGRTPSPNEYNSNFMQIPSPQYQPPNLQVMQQQPNMYVQQQFSLLNMNQQPIQQQQQPEQIVLNKVTQNYQEGIQPMDNAAGIDVLEVKSVLDMDSQQYSFDLGLNQFDSAELAAFGSALAENLSSGLSITDEPDTNKTKMETNNAAESNSMTDSFTRLTNNTIQELCTLNSMYKPMRDNDS